MAIIFFLKDINWFQAFLGELKRTDDASWVCWFEFLIPIREALDIWYKSLSFVVDAWSNRMVQVSINSQPVTWQHELKASIPQIYPNPKSSSQFSILNVDLWKSWNQMNLAIHPLVHQKDNANPACLGGHISSWWIYVDLSSNYSAPFITSHLGLSLMIYAQFCFTLGCFCYSFHHNHGSMPKWQDIWRVTTIGNTPIFNWLVVSTHSKKY